MFYPTGDSTNGRTLVSLEEFTKNNELLENEESFMNELDNWLEANEYCVQESELKWVLEDCGFCSDDIEEMEGGGAPDGGGGAFATLGTTPGMGNVAAPGVDGTPGSGDVFTTLTPGTPAAKKRTSKKIREKKVRKKAYREISDFDTFVKAMKTYQ